MTRGRMTCTRSLIFCLLVALLLVQGCVVLRGAQILEGRSNGKAVRSPVHILRDIQGVPHIFAQDEGDLFYALGYAMAHDRLFQMDFYRHLAEGRLSEMFGNPYLGKGLRLVQLDILLRCFQVEERARDALKELTPCGAYMLNRFTSGVNAFVGDAEKDRPPEYKILIIHPEVWKEEDVLAIPEIMGMGMAAINILTEVVFDTISHHVGEERAKELLQYYSGRPADGPGSLIPSDNKAEWASLPVGHLFSLIAQWMPRGSNNWVVSGRRSATGYPVLANDPHVPLEIAPNFWYHVHLHGGGFAVEGLMYPGYPGLGAGWNGRMAWGVTNIMADQIDLYRDRLNPEDQGCYQYGGQWERFEIKEEHIKVRTGRDRTFIRKSGRHGFLIPGEVFENEYGKKTPLFKHSVSLKAVQTQPARFFEGQIELARARNRTEFCNALEKLSSGPLAFNFVWADVEGNIGYQAVGKIPIREDNQGSWIRDGWNEGGEWIGYIPFDQLFRMENPQEQFLVTANNRIAPEEYPYYITDDYVLPIRAERIRELLKGSAQCTPQDFMAFQADVYAIYAKRIVRLLYNALAVKGTVNGFDTREKKAWEILGQWDFHTRADSQGAAIYEVLFNEIMWNTFLDEFGEELSQVMFRTDFIGAKLMDRLLDMPESYWFDDVRTKDHETRDDVLIRSFKDAVKKLKKWIGRDPLDWTWGSIHPLYLTHPFGLIPLFGRPFRISTLNYPGDNDTVNAGYFFAFKDTFPVFAGAASRMIVDLSRQDGAWFNCSTGMSGDPFSRYFHNLTEGWYNHQYFWTSRSCRGEDIRAENHLVLDR